MFAGIFRSVNPSLGVARLRDAPEPIDTTVFQHLVWEDIDRKNRLAAKAEADLIEMEAERRDAYADRYADEHCARLREKFMADEIDLETLEEQVDLAVRGFVPNY